MSARTPVQTHLLIKCFAEYADRQCVENLYLRCLLKPGDWKDELRRGFVECFRVLKPEGVLVFKWNENDVPVSQILALTPERPTVGNRCGKSAKSHWIVFLKATTEAK